MKEEVETKNQEYQDRYRFWSEKRVSQLSFHNNLLLTVGIAIIGFSWEQRKDLYTDLVLNIELSIDWKVFLFLSAIFFTTISIILGLASSISRLYGMRLTSNIILTRKRLLEWGIKDKAGEDLKDEKLLSTSFLMQMLSLANVFARFHKFEIAKEDLIQEGLQKKSTEARQKSDDLGKLAWSLLNCKQFL